jgi:uncharacterized metal-binding protein
MPDLPQKKVGIVACSGEEMAEGTVTRLAALKVLEVLRPDDTATICLPLFLAGGEGDRAFARFYPTVAIDGCQLSCAARATEMYSGKPAAAVVVSDLVAENRLEKPAGLRHLNQAGQEAVEATAEHVADLVDQLLDRKWSRRAGAFKEELPAAERQTAQEAACSCVSDIPVQKVSIDGQTVTLVALPLIFEQFRQAGKQPGTETTGELLEQLKIYNPVSEEQEAAYSSMLHEEYSTIWDPKVAVR